MIELLPIGVDGEMREEIFVGVNVVERLVRLLSERGGHHDDGDGRRGVDDGGRDDLIAEMRIVSRLDQM